MQQKTLLTKEGVQIYYEYNKGRHNPVIVFIHGFGGNSSAWEGVKSYFDAKGYPTLCYDIRGHGKSGKPRRKEFYLFENNVKDIYDIIEKEGIENVVLVGHCSGAMIAMDYYTKNPKKVRKMVFLNGSYTNPLKHFIIPLDKAMFIIKPMMIGIVLLGKIFRKRKVVYTKYMKYRRANILKRVYRDMIGIPFDVYAWSFLSLINCKERYNLRDIDVPVLILAGEKDWITKPSTSIKMSKSIKGAKLDFIKGVGHESLFKCPEIISRKIESFIGT